MQPAPLRTVDSDSSQLDENILCHADCCATAVQYPLNEHYVRSASSLSQISPSVHAKHLPGRARRSIKPHCPQGRAGGAWA